MGTLAEVEAAIVNFPADKLAELEQLLSRFHEWMLSHRLGRKLTLNAQDFTVFGEFTCLGPVTV